MADDAKEKSQKADSKDLQTSGKTLLSMKEGEQSIKVVKNEVDAAVPGSALQTFYTRITPDSSPGNNILNINGLPANTRVISVWRPNGHQATNRTPEEQSFQRRAYSFSQAERGAGFGIINHGTRICRRVVWLYMDRAKIKLFNLKFGRAKYCEKNQTNHLILDKKIQVS